MDRILAFSLASPLAKFLNGLEILLNKAQVSDPTDGDPCLDFDTSSLFSAPPPVPLSSSFYSSSLLLQDWENNASRSVSLRVELEQVTQLIIQWRKLELR